MLTRPTRRLGVVAVAGVLTLLAAPAPLVAGTPSQLATAADTGTILPLEDFSPAFLGAFRKLMVIESDIERHTETYGVDLDLARSVCLYESGGNANLNSWAGAKGYFQVMPATFRGLRVETNIEAGVKYLSQMIRRFEREDYALAAYNGGPGRVSRGRPPLESLQYVL
ncbi:MAG: transglycosylase SLT domain-containing protein, partial [Vicinamibacterales bacterium]